MLILVVHIHLLAEHLDAFRQATIENGRNSRREPAIARFDFFADNDDPTRFVLVEVYRDPEGPVKHKETAHYLAWAEKITPMLAEPRVRRWYSNVDPADEGF